MDWLKDFVEWRSEMGALRFALDLVFLIPTLYIFHYLMYHTNISYKTAKNVRDWLPILVVLVLMIVVTVCYS